MQVADQGLPPDAALNGTGLRVGIVRARFNAGVTDSLAAACRGELIRLGVDAASIDLVDVAGALEIPVALQALAFQDRFDALVAIGCVVRGETYHFELVANESSAGVSRVALDHRLPIANAILTVDTLGQAIARQTDKGVDAARAAVEMAHLVKARR